MKWYYEWRLHRVQAEISALQELTKAKLKDDYTGHSRLRVLTRVAGSLEKRLAKYPGNSVGKEVKQAPQA